MNKRIQMTMASHKSLPIWAGVITLFLAFAVHSEFASSIEFESQAQNSAFELVQEATIGDEALALDISGDTLVIGVGGQYGARIYQRYGSTWVLHQEIRASYIDPVSDSFGRSVAIDGDMVVIGTPWDSSDAVGINGDGNNTLAPGSGAAYVFRRQGSSWIQEAYLKPSNTPHAQYFGNKVSISGNTIAVSSYLEKSNGRGVNGEQNNSLASQSGAVYIFTRDGGAWSQQAYIKASNADSHDQFGGAVQLSGDLLVVGAARESSKYSGVNANQDDNGWSRTGAAYAFSRTGDTWKQEAYIKASNTNGGDGFGESVAISGNTIVVGAQRESSNAKGVNSNQSDNSASQSGAAYVFQRKSGSWTQQAYLKASNTDPGDWFGFAISALGDTILISAPNEKSVALGIDGDQSDNSYPYSGGYGAVYFFSLNNGQWSQDAYFKGFERDGLTRFGALLAQSGSTKLITGSDGVLVYRPPGISEFAIGGTVSGLKGSGLTLNVNGSNKLSITKAGTFFFPMLFDDGESFVIEVTDQPSGPRQTCVASNASGIIVGADVVDVEVQCITDTFQVKVVVEGLVGPGLVLRNNGGDNLMISSNGTYAFSTLIPDGMSYHVSILSQPEEPGMSCRVISGAGKLKGQDVIIATHCFRVLFKDSFELF